MAIEARAHRESVSPRKLWFGLTASAVSWLALGFVDLVIVWIGCAHDQQYPGQGVFGISRTVSFILALLLLLVAISSGTISYRNWHALSGQGNLLHSSASEPREFIAMLGVIVTVTLGAGIFWLALPPLFIQFCARVK